MTIQEQNKIDEKKYMKQIEKYERIMNDTKR